MHTTLYLTQAEQAQYDGLSEALREGWDTEEEVLQFNDDVKKRQVRLDLMDLDSKKLENLILRCGPTCTEPQLEELVAEMDFSKLSDADLWEICFALGADAMTYMLGKLLQNVQTDEQLEGICAFTFLRHEFLKSVQK